MTRFPYPTDPAKAFDKIEADALTLERIAGNMEASAAAIERMVGSQDAIQQLRSEAAALRRMIELAGFISGRVGFIYKLYEPVPYRRESSYGGSVR